MNKIIIDKEKCIGCGVCTKDCPAFSIGLVNSKAEMNGSCIECGHCYSICPVNAVDMTGYDTSIVTPITPMTDIDSETLLKAMKSRRTVRHFKDQAVEQEKIDMILEAGRMAPTGANSQGTRYVILDEKKDECEAVAVRMFSKVIGIGKKIIPQIASMQIDSHFFFKKAPLVIVIFGKDSVSASLAAENMAFMAEANGLGVLFSGFFTTCVNMSSKIRKIMGISKKPKAVTTLVIGYPAVKYHRTPHRKPLNLKRV